MTKILKFMIDHCSFLYAGERYGYGRYRFVDSRVAASFGGDAWLILESEFLRLQFVSDRDTLDLFVQGTTQRRDKVKEWYSIDVIRRMITGARDHPAELSEDDATFLYEHLEEIESHFTPPAIADTVETLERLERVRAKELFG